MKPFKALILSVITAGAICGCGSSQKPGERVNLFEKDSTATNLVTVPYKQIGSHEQVQVSFNGVPFNMLWDTGCSTTCITQSDFMALYKESAISADDFQRKIFAQIADGSYSENLMFNVAEVQVKGDNGKVLTLKNVDILVNADSEGSRLIGKNIIDQLGNYEKDDISLHMVFKEQEAGL